METSIGAALVPALALGAALAVAAAWARLSAGAGWPHLGVGALAGVSVLAGFRLAAVLPTVTVLPLLALAGAGLAYGAYHLHVAVLRSERSHPALADVAVLAAFLALAALLRPLTAVPLPFGPLGARATTAPALAAAATAAAVCLALLLPHARRYEPALRWAGFGAGLAVVSLLAGGVLGGGILAGTGLLALPDTAGLAVRAAAAGLLGRGGPWHAALAGLGLGVAEILLGVVSPFGVLSILPAVVAGGLGFAWWWQHPPHPAGLEAR